MIWSKTNHGCLQTMAKSLGPQTSLFRKTHSLTESRAEARVKIARMITESSDSDSVVDDWIEGGQMSRGPHKICKNLWSTTSKCQGPRKNCIAMLWYISSMRWSLQQDCVKHSVLTLHCYRLECCKKCHCQQSWAEARVKIVRVIKVWKKNALSDWITVTDHPRSHGPRPA